MERFRVEPAPRRWAAPASRVSARLRKRAREGARVRLRPRGRARAREGARGRARDCVCAC